MTFNYILNCGMPHVGGTTLKTV